MFLKGVHVFNSLGISQFSTLRWTFFQDVVRSAARGCNSIGIWRNKLDELGLDEACDLLHEMKLSVSSLSWCGGFTGSEGSSFELQVEDAMEAIAQAAALRAGCLLVHPGSLNGHIRRHARRLLEEAFRQLLPVARDYGIRLALEPMTASCWTMLDGLAATLEFCEQYPAEQVGIVWDLGHVGTDREAWQRLPHVLPRIAVVQLADRKAHHLPDSRCPLGQGSVPLRAWLNQFRDCGYRGPWEIETPCLGLNRGVNRCVLEPMFDYLAASQTGLQVSWPSQL